MQKTEAVILRRQEVRETSLILIAFTRDFGKIHGLVKGVRGARAAVPWYLEPLTRQAIVVYERRRSTISLISSFDLIDAFDPIRRDLVKTAYAGLCLDLVDAMTEVGDRHPEIFDLLVGTLKALEEGTDPRSIARFFEVNLLKLSGLVASTQSLPLSPGAKATLQQILQMPMDRLTRLRLSREVEGELRQLIAQLFGTLLDRELKSRTFLSALGLEGSVTVHAEPVEA